MTRPEYPIDRPDGRLGEASTLFFDLDGTLYPASNGLWEAILNRMERYLNDRMGIPEAEIPRLRSRYLETYGTTLRGLQAHHEVDTEDYLAFVHDLPLTEYLRPDPVLKRIIGRLPQQCWVFTNADFRHAQRVLSILDLEGCFQGVIDVIALGFQCKPNLEAYHLALELAGNPEPQACVLFDDSPRNLAGAKRAGLSTALVGGQNRSPWADVHLPSLHRLPHVFTGWNEDRAG